MPTFPPTSTTRTAPHRLPAPALFIGPPSHNTSTHTLRTDPSTSPSPSSPSPPGHTDKVTTRPARPTVSSPSAADPASPSSSCKSPSTAAAPLPQPPPAPETGSLLDLTRPSDAPLRARPSRSSIEAQWSELQRTLDEVEGAGARAVGGGDADGGGGGGVAAAAGLDGGPVAGGASAAAVFGAGHARALQELRSAQIRLAEAWAPRRWRRRKSEDGEGEGEGEGKEEVEEEEQGEERDTPAATAGERRDRNDEYFEKVKSGVRDVVGRLDEVSRAMREVESEGREVWDGSSLDSRETGKEGKT